MSNATVSSVDARYTYTGKTIKPTPKVKYSGATLTKGTDYTVSYSSNKAVGTATITIKGTGNYTGTVKKTFKIVPKKVSNLKVKSSSSKKITVTWTSLKSVRGYQIQYSTSSDFSNAKTVTVVGTTNKKKVISGLKKGKTYYVRIRSYCKVSGTNYYSFYSSKVKIKVTARKMSNATVSSVDARYTYTGKTIKPTPKVKYSGATLTKGTDYTVSYSSNKAVGTATITIKGTGNYTGTVKKTFKIVPKKVSNLKVKSSSSKKITVTWTSLKSVRGYQIQYSTSSDFSNAKTVTVVGTTNKKKVISGLKKGKTYYVRIRSYCKVSGTNYYSFYSSKVKIKVK
ncbi:MAG: fibronectin type III domain-containing protein [Clostridiales bacterium]|nr:fibronectin type III domain-containing protein [Clostridiales bacterium]